MPIIRAPSSPIASESRWSICASGTPRWEADTGAANNSFAISPDGTTIATGFGAGDKPLIRLWDAATGRVLGDLAGHHGWVACVLFLPDSRRLVSCSADQTIRVWDLAKRTTLRTLRGHRTEVWRIALLPDGKTLVSGCKDGSSLLWTLETPPPMPASAVLPPGPDQWWTLAGDGGAIVRLKDTGQIVRYSPAAMQDEELLMDIGRPGWAIVDERRPLVATNAPPSRVRVIDWSRRAPVGEFPLGWLWRDDPGWSMGEGAFSRDGNSFAAVFAHRDANRLRFREWEIGTGCVLRSHEFAVESNGRRGAVFSPDLGAGVRTQPSPAPLLRLDLRTGRTAMLPWNVREPGIAGFSANGRLLAVPSRQSYVRIFDAATGEARQTFGGFMFGVHAAAFFANDARLAAGSTTFEGLTLWDLTGGERVLTLGTEASFISFIRFSPDGNTIAGQEFGGRINWWRAPSWAEIEAAEKTPTRNAERSIAGPLLGR